MAGQARFVEGDLLVHPPAGVSGWCRLPMQTSARAEIEILVDSICVATISASRDNDGSGGGRHAFSLILPAVPDESATCVIEARERGSGLVFGRAVLFEDMIAWPIERRLAELDFGGLKAPLATVPADPAPRLRACFSALGIDLQEAAGISALAAGVARRMPRLALSARPEVSVIVQASPQIGSTLRLLAGLQSLADTIPIEVIVADDGADPHTALLPLICRKLRYGRDPAGLTGSVLNRLVLEARGNMICFLDHDPPAGDWLWPQPAMADGQIHLGDRLARNVDVPVAVRRRDQHGFALYLARTEILCAGGLDPALRAMDSLTDVAMKCRLLGAGITAWLHAGPGPGQRW